MRATVLNHEAELNFVANIKERQFYVNGERSSIDTATTTSRRVTRCGARALIFRRATIHRRNAGTGSALSCRRCTKSTIRFTATTCSSSRSSSTPAKPWWPRHPSVDYDIQFVGNIKSALFGGEGLFFATLRGPGNVWLQSLPLSRLAGRIVASAKSGREEGSVLGGLGRLLDGDNS
jgi:hypothetical protein